MITLSLLVAYRQRPEHLARLVEWYQQYRKAESKHPVEIIVVESDVEPMASGRDLSKAGLRYFYTPGGAKFHKTLALNVALSHARGKFVTPYDVDLLPFDGVMTRHIDAALTSPMLVVAGHRLMARHSHVDSARADTLTRQVDIAPEDRPVSLQNQLIHGERLGMVPLFQRKRLMSIGGWDEQFIGWGCEDQDVIERYLKDDMLLVRSPDLIYLHYPHFLENNWHEVNLVASNRRIYYSRTGQRRRLW